ncbi:hypothetical protein B0J13DRAFT_526443 [Dactylonectria estremocensis]|uniref:Uncharacterized protein n=1 Tax=Dactylonectria estremocensis TaxID=1079267 RepID=A0A9P9IZ46_9HYPO|nr:hypothetical protein B0J13DRAFT_526443 [Dactylonectria estremocensis]
MCNRACMRRSLSNGLGIGRGSRCPFFLLLPLPIWHLANGFAGGIPRSPWIESIPAGWFCGLLESSHQPVNCIGQGRNVPRTTGCRWVCPNDTLPTQRVGARRYSLPTPFLQAAAAAGREQTSQDSCVTSVCLRHGALPYQLHQTSRVAATEKGTNTRARHHAVGMTQVADDFSTMLQRGSQSGHPIECTPNLPCLPVLRNPDATNGHTV